MSTDISENAQPSPKGGGKRKEKLPKEPKTPKASKEEKLAEGVRKEKLPKEPKAKKSKAEAVPQTVPSVNLLSAWVHEENKAVQLWKKLLIGVAVLALVVTGVWAFQFVKLSQERNDLEAAQDESTKITEQIQELTPVSDYVANVTDRATLISEVMYTQISFARVYQEISDSAAQSSIVLENLSISMPDPNTPPVGDLDSPSRGLAQTCPGPNPFASADVIGCIQISGTAPQRENVGEFANTLEASDVFTESYFGSTTTGPNQPVIFSGSVSIAPEVFTGKYDNLPVLLLGESQEESN